jgi:hypothetical protein
VWHFLEFCHLRKLFEIWTELDINEQIIAYDVLVEYEVLYGEFPLSDKQKLQKKEVEREFQ